MPKRLASRHTAAAFNRMGGKYNLCRRIAAVLDHWGDRMCIEVFCGAAHVTLARKPAFIEVINDLDGDISNAFRIIREHPNELLRQMEWYVASREEYERLVKVDGELLTDVQRAVVFLYANRFSNHRKAYIKYGPTARWGWATDPQFKKLAAVRDRLKWACIECMPWQKCVKWYDGPERVFYFDPPYQGYANLYGKGLFAEEDHDRLAQTCRSLKGHFLLSINDSPSVRSLYQGCHIAEVQTTYNSGLQRSRATELLIADRPIPKDVLAIINEGGSRHAQAK